MKIFVGFLLLLAHTAAFCQNNGIFDRTADVGPVLHPGTTVFESDNQAYRLTGAGSNIWFKKDEFHYTFKRITGNFILQARGRLLDKGVDPHRKFGWMVRTGLDTSAAMVCAAIHGDGLTAIQFRKTNGANIEEVKSPVRNPDVFQLERRGRSYFLSVAHSGEPYWTVEVPDFDFPAELFVGLFVCAHNKDVLETAEFDNVRLIIPAKPDFQPYRDYIGSNLEWLDVNTGHRQSVYLAPNSLQAPNWTADGKALIYNADGLIYRFDFSSGKPALVNTDPVRQNNNDHVLSFNGKMLGLSSSGSDSKTGSQVYTVPIEGGTPKLITPEGPSYLHGWSPDGKWLTFTGQRNNEFDIYKIPAKGGKEVRLTNAPGLDDGSEFSPDGKFIYFNSVRSGKMEIWRMKPDGANPEQLTNDEYQNWFPHVSPDGKWLAFISYSSEVKPEDHPFYQRAYLRLMPTGGGKPKVIAYLYGGQGSMNTPSWSPDSRKIAFISNSDAEKSLNAGQETPAPGLTGIPVKGYNHVGLYVNDIQKSTRFYRDIVGLEPIEVPDYLKAIRSWFKIGPAQQLHLLAGRTEPVTNNGLNSCHFSLSIADADPVEAYLKSKSVEYVRQWRFDSRWQIYITDPDGYVIEMTEEKPIWRSLMNGKDFDGWDTWLGAPFPANGTDRTGIPPIGLNNDPKHVFSMVTESGGPALHISGENFGGIYTRESFSNYHLQLQYKWGKMKWHPKEKEKMDSGLLYHSIGENGADFGSWMQSQEFQIQEGDSGDYWGVAGGMFDVPVVKTGEKDWIFDPKGEKMTFAENAPAGRHAKRWTNEEKPAGEWNTIDLYCFGDQAVHVVNGKVVMVLYKSRRPGKTGTEPLTEGKIQLQSEGAEIYYRNIRLRPIDRIPDYLLK
jgi:Tol biopolymer transport system component